jgi:aminopeptidase
MGHIKQGGVFVLALTAGALSGSAQPAKAPAPNYAEIANRIVGTSAHVKEGDVVQIDGGPADLPLMEELSIACSVRGAYPLLTISTESLTKKWIAQSLPKYDAKVNTAALALAKSVDVIISIPSTRDDSIYASFPGERSAQLNKAYVATYQTLLRRNVRQVSLDNGLAPSPSRAKALGIDEAEMSALYWSGLAADYAGVEAKGNAVKDLLAKAGELHITLPNGTDLKMKIKGRKAFVSDGVISDADMKTGAGAILLYMPAGEVFVTPVPGTAEGKIVDDRMVFFGKEILGITADVKAGKITAINAKSGWDAIKSQYDAMPISKLEVSSIDLGINPAVRTGGKLETYMGAGNLTIGTGGNEALGGSIKDLGGLYFMMSGATITLDGTTLVDKGVLK